MKKIRRAAALLLCAVLYLLPLSAADGRVSLYVGDRAWNLDSLMPFVESDGKQLLPLSVFGEFADVTLTVSEPLGSALLEGKDGWLSLSLNFGTCLDEQGETRELPLYRYDGEIYVEPSLLCEKFSLTFETTYAADGYLTARLTDGSEALTFEELLAVYGGSDGGAPVALKNPTRRTVEGTFMHPVMLVPAAASVPQLIRLLGAHSTTFALDPAEIEKYADVLPQIYASGHTVAYFADAGALASPAAFEREMQTANDYLFALLGKTSRIYVSTELTRDIPSIDGYFKKSCRMNLVADDLSSERMVNIALSESPDYGIFNFSLSSDADTRALYRGFFAKFDTYTALRAMPMTEASANQ